MIRASVAVLHHSSHGAEEHQRRLFWGTASSVMRTSPALLRHRTDEGESEEETLVRVTGKAAGQSGAASQDLQVCLSV